MRRTKYYAPEPLLTVNWEELPRSVQIARLELLKVMDAELAASSRRIHSFEMKIHDMEIRILQIKEEQSSRERVSHE